MNVRSLFAPLPLVLSGLLLSATARADVQSFEVDRNHTVIGFKASTLLFDVPGRFEQYKVQVTGEPESGKDARVRLEIDASSVDTMNKTRDKHLRSPDFFDVARHPKITFTSESVSVKGDKVVVAGTLDMHGVKKQITIPFTAVSAKNGAGVLEHVYKAEVPLNRKDFGVGADSVAAKISMKDEVQLSLLLAGFFSPAK